MKYLHILSVLFRSKIYSNRSFSIFKNIPIITCFNFKPHMIATQNKINKIFVHTDSDNEEYEDIPIVENGIERYQVSRNIFKYFQDDIITKLNSCVSIEEVLNLVMRYQSEFEDKHILQTILILKDLQSAYYQYNGFNNKAWNIFSEKVTKNEGFISLVKCVSDRLDYFEPEYLSYVLLYLNKLGVPIDSPLMQNIAVKVRDHLLNNFCIGHCSRFLTAVFAENSVRPYNLSLLIIPLVTGHIEKCSTVDDIHNLTICLNKLHNLINVELLAKYKMKVVEFLKNKKLVGTNYTTLLKIILFLNYPHWRDNSVSLISECILTLKNEINLLEIGELSVLYEVFFKNQEPGVVLNTIQRCSAKFVNQLDEYGTIENITKLKLISSLIYFSAPVHRIRFQDHIKKYFNMTSYKYNDLVQLRNIFSYIKVTDPRLCTDYWNLCLKILDEDEKSNVLKLCQNYINFNASINNYRHYKFEARVMNHISASVAQDPFLNPSKVCGYLSFAMLYGKNTSTLKMLLRKFEEDLNRVKAADCLKVSHSLFLTNSRRYSFLSQEEIEKMKMLLNKCTRDIMEIDGNNYLSNTMLLKGLIFRNDFNNELLESLLTKYKDMDFMSSKIIENLCYIFTATYSVVPEVINKCTEYVVKHKSNILGFNAQKLLYVCYYLGYYPINNDKFFAVVTDLIIRDQQRLSGLSFLKSALSLCYFNKLPSSFIKQIFNVQFLEKLDLELENCYSKDKYPQRVRKILMVLNRAVCLEYPEYNVPWFHQKYIENVRNTVKNDIESVLQRRIKEYLLQLLDNKPCFMENIITPYGYHIHFVVYLDNKNDVVSSDSPNISRRVALLLLRPSAFTRFYTHLKGSHQLKIRHLEILGYEVVLINIQEWVNLLYGAERFEYLSKLIWPNDKKNTVDVFRR